MSNDEIIRRRDALEALGEEPMVWCEDDPAQVQEHNGWEHMIDAINAIPCMPFQLHELTETEVCGLHGDNVIVSARLLRSWTSVLCRALGRTRILTGRNTSCWTARSTARACLWTVR